MSSTSSDSVSTCANCGKGGEGEVDSIQLKTCTACKMVKYCSRECQIAHRPQHKKECRQRAAELYDLELFKQPPPEEDCPICFLRMPSLWSGSKYMSCCGKTICSGCIHAVYMIGDICPFCRTQSTSMEKANEMEIKQMEKNDPKAIHNQGSCYSEGKRGYPQDYSKAIEYWQRSAQLGHAGSYYNIAVAYGRGKGVQRDMKKAEHYFELAAIGGEVIARHNLGVIEQNKGIMDRALKHHMIAVGSGGTKSLEAVKHLYIKGKATKENYAEALRVYQAYLDDIRSDQRDAAATFSNEYKFCE